MESSEIIDFVGRHEPALMAKTAQIGGPSWSIESTLSRDTSQDFNTILGVLSKRRPPQCLR